MIAGNPFERDVCVPRLGCRMKIAKRNTITSMHTFSMHQNRIMRKNVESRGGGEKTVFVQFRVPRRDMKRNPMQKGGGKDKSVGTGHSRAIQILHN